MSAALVQTALLALFSLQGFLMAVDEWAFHRRRGLGAFERWGHPVDSLFYLVALSLPAWSEPRPEMLRYFALAGALSCLVITKDEPLHARHCGAAEHWVHALLFTLHPLVLVFAAWAWALGEAVLLRRLLPLGVGAFALYQLAAAWLFYGRGEERRAVNNAFYDELGEGWYTEQSHPIALLRAESPERVRYIESVIRRLGLVEPRILDLGCGAGLIAIPLAARGFSVKGVDLSPSSLEVARRRAPPGARLVFERGDVYALAEESESYDLVLMMDLLEHLEEPEKAIGEASAALRPGGALVFHTFNRTPLSYLFAVRGIELMARNAPRDIHAYRLFIKPRELRAMCARAGLDLVELVGIRPRFSTRAFWWTLFHRRVHPDFGFRRSRSLAVGYLGFALKRDGS